MGKTYRVANQLELGNAIWSARADDLVVLDGGDYCVLPLKAGVNYDFQRGATVALMPGNPSFFDGDCSAPLIEIDNTSIRNPALRPGNIKCFYCYAVKLPFNLRLPKVTKFIHANGAIVTALGNDKDGFF